MRSFSNEARLRMIFEWQTSIGTKQRAAQVYHFAAATNPPVSLAMDHILYYQVSMPTTHSTYRKADELVY